MLSHNGGYDSPSAPDGYHQHTPVQNRNQNNERTTNKRPRSYISPAGQQQQTEIPPQVEPAQHWMTHPTANEKISFPPIVVKFHGEQQQSSIKEITDDFTSKC